MSLDNTVYTTQRNRKSNNPTMCISFAKQDKYSYTTHYYLMDKNQQFLLIYATRWYMITEVFKQESGLGFTYNEHNNRVMRIYTALSFYSSLERLHQAIAC